MRKSFSLRFCKRRANHAAPQSRTPLTHARNYAQPVLEGRLRSPSIASGNLSGRSREVGSGWKLCLCRTPSYVSSIEGKTPVASLRLRPHRRVGDACVHAENVLRRMQTTEVDNFLSNFDCYLITVYDFIISSPLPRHTYPSTFPTDHYKATSGSACRSVLCQRDASYH